MFQITVFEKTTCSSNLVYSGNSLIGISLMNIIEEGSEKWAHVMGFLGNEPFCVLPPDSFEERGNVRPVSEDGQLDVLNFSTVCSFSPPPPFPIFQSSISASKAFC